MGINTVNSILSITILCILLIWIHVDVIMNRDRAKRLIYCVSLTIVVIMAEMVCELVDNTGASNRWINIVFNMIWFIVSPYILIYESKLYSGREKRFKAYIPAIINSIIVALSPITHWIYYIAEPNQYCRGNLFFIYLLIVTYSIVYSCVVKYLSVKNLPPYFRYMILSGSLFILFGGIVQFLYPKYNTIWIIITMYLVLYYAFSCVLNSMYDSLTGLLNRTAYDNQIQYLMNSKKRNVVVFMVDVNDFKEINDTKGHSYGDYCLQEIAKMLKESFSQNEQIFRYGGDEFCIIAYLKSEDEVKNYIKRINSIFVTEQGKNYFMPNISIGYDVYCHDGNILETVEEADRNMYENKKKNKMEEA